MNNEYQEILNRLDYLEKQNEKLIKDHKDLDRTHVFMVILLFGLCLGFLIYAWITYPIILDMQTMIKNFNEMQNTFNNFVRGFIQY